MNKRRSTSKRPTPKKTGGQKIKKVGTPRKSAFRKTSRKASPWGKSPAPRTRSRPETLRRVVGRGKTKTAPSIPGRKLVRRKELPSPRRGASKIPPLEKGVIRIIPLGGVEEIGRNMMVIEMGDDIIIVDVGFIFTNEDTPGVDYLLPNVAYLEERKEKIRGIFITHGHYDHIGAVPYVMDKIGNPPIYTRKFGSLIIKKRQEEFPHQPPLDFRIIEGTETITAGKNFKVTPFPLSHTIPDSIGLVIKTSLGEIIVIEDVRVDNVEGVVSKKEFEQYAQFKDRKILLLALDSTSIEKPGFSISEETIIKNIEKIIRDVKGRLIIGAFASQVERIVEMFKLARKYDKKIVVEGRSMKTNVEIAKQLKLIDPTQIIPVEEVDNYPPNKIMMIATGAQGEEFAALMRMANKTHRKVQLNKTDTVLLSASIIPGNERTITKLKDGLYRSEAKIITYLDSDVHASGHGSRGELEWIHKQINYKFFMPIHGHHYMLRQNAESSMALGTPRENIVVPNNGSIIEISDNGNKIIKRKEEAPSYVLMVDGFSIGNTQEVVIRDRKMLAQDGIFVLIAAINSQTGKLKKSPDIIARGFVYVRESQELLRQARTIIKDTVEEATAGMNPINFEYIKGLLTDNISRFLFQQTAKRPLVIPVLLSV